LLFSLLNSIHFNIHGGDIAIKIQSQKMAYGKVKISWQTGVRFKCAFQTCDGRLAVICGCVRAVVQVNLPPNKKSTQGVSKIACALTQTTPPPPEAGTRAREYLSGQRGSLGPSQGRVMTSTLVS